VGGGVAYLTLSGSPDWYATGKSVELASEQQNDAFLVGPVGALPTACTAKMNAAECGQRPVSTGEGQVIKGWDSGLVGQAVGSRVLLVVPPADGYNSSGQSQVGINGTDTLVFVVDILAAA
jgi:peptidylprolyl isomerase